MYNVCVDLAIVVQRDRDLVLKAAVFLVIKALGVHVECVRRFVFNAWVVRKPAYLPLACLHVFEAALGEIRLAPEWRVDKFHRLKYNHVRIMKNIFSLIMCVSFKISYYLRRTTKGKSKYI